ncbi:MAG: GIY-YIG nuclease family protein [Chitinophagaceae bacterium]|nr:MAG: GIY-YIG nuclease family protein [Chitinophagaceae bacterium]
MPYYTYILKSESTGKFYCGQTDNLEQRLQRHNEGNVKSTKFGRPWVMHFQVLCESRSEAMLLEKTIKRRGITRWLAERPELKG